LLRALRHWLVARVTDGALSAAPHLSPRAADRLAGVIARLGPRLPVLARMVADNMRAAGVYSAAAHRAYFAQLAGHFAGALHALRCAAPTTAGGSPALAALAAQRVELDDSVQRLQAALSGGRGVILVGPHICNYLLNLARLNQTAPLTVYLRYSKDRRRQAAKERWYRASGVAWISEPAGAGGPLGRLGRMAAALHAGRVLFITPDLPQKRDDGVAVRFFGREIYLPAGPALLAERTGAPLFALTAAPAGPRQRLLVHGPIDEAESGRGISARRAAVRRRMQWFAAQFEHFVRTSPELWYLWGDKRWTRVFRGDTRYVGPLGVRHCSATSERTSARRAER
jgi:lauroyl/myristoyl acyltransferase